MGKINKYFPFKKKFYILINIDGLNISLKNVSRQATPKMI